jgi:hypothetical protein
MIQSIENGRKEDGNRSIADKIKNRLRELEMAVDNNQGRWAWELLQNAKDSVTDTDRKVSVEIILNSESVSFRHNGKHFNEQDVRGLINQISSKEVEKGQVSTRTGRFGTGFLTTHLLSKVIDVKSIVETIDGEYYHFAFPLNRDGNTTTQLIPKIEKAWAEFHASTENNQVDDFDEEEYNTSFTYTLNSEEQMQIARTGIDEFSELIPFVLAFNTTIEKVIIIDKITEIETEYLNCEELTDDVLLSIKKKEDGEESIIKLLFAREDNVAIASIVDETLTGLKIKNLKTYPKLFCDFPLIGTENFHFPLIVNSFHFNPVTERDGIWLKGEGKEEVDENREILKKAVSLYEELLDKITELEMLDYHNICLTKMPFVSDKWFDEDWYETNIQTPLRKIILTSNVIETEDGKICFNETRFPDPKLKKEEREKIWKFSTDLKVNTLPAKRHIHKWADLIWKDCPIVDIDDLVADLQSKKNIVELINVLGLDESRVVTWLNKCFEFIYELGGQSYFNNNALLPDQTKKGIFKKRKELSLDEIDDETVKEIALLLGYNYYEKLLNLNINFEDTHSITTIQDVAAEISQLVKDDDEITDDRKIAIRKLTQWFEFNEEIGKTHFADLYRRKEKLFVDTIEDKENLYKVLKTKMPLSQLVDVANAIENDPEIINIIEQRRIEREEELERNEIGEKVERILAEALKQYGFEVKKEIYGKDLVISISKNKSKFSLEVKSTINQSYVSMTPFQARTAVKETDNYALCVVYKNGTTLTKDYVRKHSKFVIDIGKRLAQKVQEVQKFESTKSEIANTNEEIDLFYENNLEYKFKISNNVWTQGISFWDFVVLIK